MSFAQRFLKAVFPRRWGESMEAESRRWIMTCEGCGAKQSIWDIGGVRWKAKGEPKMHLKCLACGESSLMTIRYEEPEASGG